MIKFFRKIRHDLMEKNKTGKYFKYAIGEVVLVVIGILIALQINNWNQSQINSEKEQVFLNQLFKGFTKNDSIIKTGISHYDRLYKFLEVHLKYTGPNVTTPKDSLVLNSLFSLNYPKIELVYNTLNVSFQQMDKLNDDDLKLALSKFPSLHSNYKESENQIKNLTIKQRQIHQKYMSLLNSVSGYEQEMFESDIIGLLRNREFQNVTVDKKWNLNGALNELNLLNIQNLNILNLIKKQIKS